MSALTPADIAERLSMSRTGVYALFNRPRDKHPLPHLKTGEKGGYRVRPETFERWLREEEQMSIGAAPRRRA